MRLAISMAAGFALLVGPLVHASVGAQEEPAAAAKTAEELRKEIAAWHKALATTDDAGAEARVAAAKALASLRDERAVPILVALWKKEQAARVRRHLAQALMSIGGRKSFAVLVDVACQDRSEETRILAAKWIAKQENREDAIPQFVKYLRGKKYFRNALTSLGYTEIVRNARRPDPELVAVLIDNLVTVTPKITRVPVHRAGMWRYRYPEFAARGPEVELVPVVTFEKSPNTQVRSLLYEYTRQDLGYDQLQWRKSVLQPLLKESKASQH
jgi:hypothetical protein